MNLDELDGRIGEGWSGEAPNGSHVNIVLARRGSPTAAAALSMFAHPTPGHTPVLVCVGPTQAEYEPVWPPTLMMNKATALEEHHQTMTWGAAQLGIGQGVLDAVADGLIAASGDLLVLVAVWVDPAAEDETTVREANRAATRRALGVCVEGRDRSCGCRACRETRLAAQSVLRRRVVRIASIETRLYRYPLDPAFSAAWDPEPRTHQDATLVIVRSDDGVEGYASGDGLPDRELLERLLLGVDPMRAGEVHEILETVDFHHGRNWTLEVAIWDLVGRMLDEPLWRHLGGQGDRILAYASSGELVAADERVRRCVALRDAGVRP